MQPAPVQQVPQVLARCQVCDMQFHFPHHILASMKMPSVFCGRCFSAYDYVMLRQWYKLDVLAQRVASLLAAQPVV